MGIRFYCPDCGRRLNIKAFLAGKRGICPHCDSRVLIPMESQLPADAPKVRPTSNEAASREAAAVVTAATAKSAGRDVQQSASRSSTAAVSLDPIAESPDSVWYVRPAAGGQYGPARGDVMRRWLSEGRVSADSMVWREGWEDWKLAGPMFPSLDSVPSPAPTVAVKPASAFVVPGDDEEQDISKPVVAPARRTTAKKTKKKSLAPLIVLGLLIIVLLVVTVIILRGS